MLLNSRRSTAGGTLVRDLYLQISEQASRQRYFSHLGCLRGSETDRAVDLGEALSGDDPAAGLIHVLPTQRKGFDRGGGRRRPSSRRSVRARGWGGSAGIRCGPCREAAHRARYLHHSVGRNPAATRAASAAVSAALDSRPRPATRSRACCSMPNSWSCRPVRRGSGRAARRRELAFAILAQSVSAIAPLLSYDGRG